MSSSSQPGRVARAATRYRPGKAPSSAAAAELSSSSDESDEEQQRRRQERKARKIAAQRDEPITDVSQGTAALKNAQRRTAGVIIQSKDLAAPLRKQIVNLQDVKIGSSQKEEEIDSDEYETDTDGSEEAGPSVPAKPVFRKPGASALVPVSAKKESSSEYETDSDEEEESEEDSRPAMLKPIFVPKKQRDSLRQIEEAANGQEGANGTKKVEGLEEGEEEDAATMKARLLMEERRKQSHLLAAETIKRELAEKEHEDGQPDLSDTDGKDPEEEFSAWRIRELSRLKADREAALEKEAERTEVERRRAMPESQRLAEDTARAQASRDAKRKERQEAAGEGGADFMQKYYHKGSFFQDLDILKKRDYQAKTESAVDVSMLPKVMQVRDYGKAGRSKWTHLSNEDTSRQQPDHRLKGISGANQHSGAAGVGAAGAAGGGQACFACGGPHLKRDCPNSQQNGREGRGANSVPLRDRQRRSRSPDERQRASNRYHR
jgi:microfibrillar-associated protein 1